MLLEQRSRFREGTESSLHSRSSKNEKKWLDRLAERKNSQEFNSVQTVPLTQVVSPVLIRSREHEYYI